MKVSVSEGTGLSACFLILYPIVGHYWSFRVIIILCGTFWLLLRKSLWRPAWICWCSNQILPFLFEIYHLPTNICLTCIDTYLVLSRHQFCTFSFSNVPAIKDFFVYTKTVDSVDGSFWLATQTQNILWYSPPSNLRGIQLHPKIC